MFNDQPFLHATNTITQRFKRITETQIAKKIIHLKDNNTLASRDLTIA